MLVKPSQTPLFVTVMLGKLHDTIWDKKFTKSPIADMKSFFPIPDQLSIDSDWPQSTATLS